MFPLSILVQTIILVNSLIVMSPMSLKLDSRLLLRFTQFGENVGWMIGWSKEAGINKTDRLREKSVVS